jgi:hypothetical protein
MSLTSDLPRARLTELVARYGEGASRDPQRCAKLLDEACRGEFPEKRAALVAAVERGVTIELASVTSEPRGLLLDRLTHRLVSDGAASRDLARWSTECWALALGAIPEGDRPRLLIIAFDELASRMRQAGSDGTIAAADVDRLVGEAVKRGIDEADARAYASVYPAARGWHIITDAKVPVTQTPVTPKLATAPRTAAVKATPGPMSPSPPPHQVLDDPPRAGISSPELSAVAPRNRWRLAIIAVIGLVVVALLGVSAIMTHQRAGGISVSQGEPRANQPVRSPEATETDRLQSQLQAERKQLEAQRKQLESERQQQKATAEQEEALLAMRDQHNYEVARGDINALQAYVNNCRVCTYQAAARSEIADLTLADSEASMYRQSLGNMEALRNYIRNCKLCSFRDAAIAQIERLESLQQPQSGSIVLCGNSVDYQIYPAGGSISAQPFLGIWTGAAWNRRTCGGLIIERVDNDGAADGLYVYGPLPGEHFPWKKQPITGRIGSRILSFQDEDGGHFTFQLDGESRLLGHFISPRGATLDATLVKGSTVQ